ncbi:transglutaminase family protein [Candidatus Latescibacterota bacterium]
MARHTGTSIIFGISFVVWLIVMGFVYRAYYTEQNDHDLETLSADLRYKSGTKQYFTIKKNGEKIGYKTETQFSIPKMIIYNEDSVVKMNFAGMSREVFIKCTAGIDSSDFNTSYLEFSLQSGMHTYNCTGTVTGDSLIIDVKINNETPYRKGLFKFHDRITFPVALPFYMHNSEAETMNLTVFDPVIFSLYTVHIIRKGSERLQINNSYYDTVKYDLEFSNKRSSMWLDDDGAIVKSNGYLLFTGELGDLAIERSTDRDVFLLPLEVTLGMDLIKNSSIIPDKTIPDPRYVQYLEVKLEGIRAANVDVGASNKKILSLNPVIFAIHTKPVITGKRLLEEKTIAASDTSLLGTSDYIQSRDARIKRTAGTIVSQGQDTLKVAREINQWVFKNMKKEKGLDIIRSTDILREMRGDCDEHTKLFTALARSLGIPTQINLGLVYEEGAFRYHSWPSILARGVWNDMDPTLGQNVIDATHIALVRGDFERSVELLRLLGRISIKILDYR